MEIAGLVKNHDILFSGASLELGKAHWYIQRANSEMEKIAYKERSENTVEIKEIELTEFGKEVKPDEIYWWVHKRETNIRELYEKTKKTLESIQRVKEGAYKLKESFQCIAYRDLITKIKEFTEEYKEEIHSFYEYVKWLHEKDVLAPIILFTYRVWGSTRLSDRTIEIKSNNINKDIDKVKECTETVLGLRTRGSYTLVKVFLSIQADSFESGGPDYQYKYTTSMEKLIPVTIRKVLEELSAYFEFMRQSLRNILIEIEKYNEQRSLLYSEEFWVKFVKKAMEDYRIENQLWDFKQTFEMWKIKKSEEKQKAIIKFCEEIASFANAKGGVLIVGISDKPPRKIIGLDDLENKLKFAKSKIKEHIDYDSDFTHFQPIQIKNETGELVSCLIIAIAQTRNVVSVNDKKGRYTYPIRVSTGFDRANPKKIKESKKRITKDNYDFLEELVAFLKD